MRKILYLRNQNNLVLLYTCCLKRKKCPFLQEFLYMILVSHCSSSLSTLFEIFIIILARLSTKRYSHRNINFFFSITSGNWNYIKKVLFFFVCLFFNSLCIYMFIHNILVDSFWFVLFNKNKNLLKEGRRMEQHKSFFIQKEKIIFFNMSELCRKKVLIYIIRQKAIFQTSKS